jgi:AcrR family transcriptional regulator
MERLSRDQKREVTRSSLRQSAAEAFARQGVIAASVDGISLAAGLSRGAFYANYESKEDLLLEMMSKWIDQEVDAWAKVVSEAKDVESALEGFMSRFVRSDQESSWGLLLIELMLHADREPKFNKHYQKFVSAHHKYVAHMYEALFAKAGKKLPADPDALASAAMLFGASMSLKSGRGSHRDDPTFAAKMFGLFLRGLLEVAEPEDAPAAKAARKTRRTQAPKA